MKLNRNSKIGKYFLYTLLGVVKLFKILLVCVLTTLLMIPFIISNLIFGLNKSNLYMSKILRKPNNWIDNDKDGDTLVYLYEKILDGSF